MKTTTPGKHVRTGLLSIAVATSLILIAIIVLFQFDNRVVQSSPPNLPARKLVGEITRINDNGRDWILDEDGKKIPGSAYGIADAGSSITVDGQTLKTSCGSCGVDDSFSVSIDGFKLGDRVVVMYAHDSRGVKTLNCNTCGITKY